MHGIMAAAPKRLVPALFPDVAVDDAAHPKRLEPALIPDAVVDDDASIFGSPDPALQLLAYCPWKVPSNFN